MKIMIDLDNVLFNCSSFPYFLGNRIFTISTFSRPLKYKIVDIKTAKSYKNSLSFFRFCNKKYFKQLRDSVQTIKKWKEQGFEIHFVSSRPNLKSIQKTTIDWLEDNNIAFDSLILSCTNKPKFLKDNNFDVMVDDTLSNCIYSSMLDINAIWLSHKKHKFPKDVNLSKIHLASNWSDVNQFVQDIYNNHINNLSDCEKQ